MFLYSQKLTEDSTPLQFKNDQKGAIDKLVYKTQSNENLLTVQKKVFDLLDQEETFYNKSNHKWVKKMKGFV